jgi:hypothetical protein
MSNWEVKWNFYYEEEFVGTSAAFDCEFVTSFLQRFI